MSYNGVSLIPRSMEQDRVYQFALQKLSANLDERRELEAFIATYLKLLNGAAAVDSPPPAPVATQAEKQEKPFKTEEIVSAAMEALAANRAPMKLGNLYQALVERGICIGGKIPRNNLGAKLSADQRLTTIPGLGWWFKNEPVPGSILEPEPDYLERDERNEEDPATEIARPSYSNGAAVSAA